MYTNYNLVKNLIGLFNKGVTVFLSNGSLKIEDSSKNLSEDEIKALKEDKSTIISFFLAQKISSSSQIGPLSLQQQRLWLIEKIESEKAQYNLPCILDLTGDLDVIAIETSLRMILNRHDVLRSVYYEEADAVYQLVRDVSNDNIVEYVDLSHLDGVELASRLKELSDDESRRAFDLAIELPLRAILIKTAINQSTLLLTMHHICGDAWSSNIVFDELTTLYSNHVKGSGKPLAELSIQYIDYADWQRDWLKEESVQGDLDYWVNRLSGVPQVHSLNLDKPRPTTQDAEAGHYWLNIDSGLQVAIDGFCQKHKVTPFILLQTVFSCFLQRYSGQRDIVMGTPVANRERSEFSELIGFFVNTLALRTDLSENLRFEELLEQNKTKILDDFEHQALPFELLVERLKPERSLSFTPVFQIVFAFQSHKRKDLHLPGLEVCTPKQGYTASKFDLTFEVIQNEEGLLFHWEYASAIFEEQTIKQMANHYLILLQAAMENPESSIDALPLMTNSEQHQLLIDWNDTAADYPKDKCIHELFEAQVEKTPNAVAVVFEAQQLSYLELNKKANQLAHYLINEKQVTPDTLVGICIERSLEMVIAIIGVLKAGGAYVPLDPEYPEARLQYMLDDAKLTTVLTQKNVYESTPVTDEQAVCFDYVDFSDQFDYNPNSRYLGLKSDHLAYMIYTSGSTGKPKGVMVEHRALVNRIDWMDRQYGSSPSDRTLQKTPFSFDVSVWEFVWPLSVGSRIVLAKPSGHKDPSYLCNLIREQGVSKLHFVPSMLSSMLALGDLSQCHSIKQVFCSGEALSLTHVENFRSTCSWVELHNLYGPTEAAIDVSYWDCSQNLVGFSSVPIGRPIDNIQLFVLDERLQTQARGVAGELHIGGVGLARGYLNRDDLTSEKFIANPFYDNNNPSSSERLYKTGDLTRFLPDGNIEYLGRIDHQVKIRGFRIELGEIENTLVAFDEINDAVVVAKDDKSGDKYIAAYVAVDDEENGLLEQIRQHLVQSLPDHMVPSVFVFLDSLPLTSNGKVDRKALPEPNVSDQQQDYVPPSTEIEKILCCIWQEVLDIERVGVNDNFFHLGGHSLLVMQVISRAQQKEVHLAARQLFSNPTLADLAADVNDTSALVFTVPNNLISDDCEAIKLDMLPLVTGITQDELDQSLAKVPGGSANVKDIYPLAPLQEGILFHHVMSEEVDPYIMPVLFSVESAKAFEDFVEGLQFIIDRHDIMRTAIIWKEISHALQIVCRKVTLPITWLELDSSQDVEAQMRVRSESVQPLINLEQAPLLRLQVAVEQKSGRHLVLVQLHHIVSDHVVLEIIQRELEAYHTGQAASLPESVPYREFVAHVQHQAQEHDAQAFFTEMLADIDEPTAPFDLLDVNSDGTRIVEFKAEVDDAIGKRVRSLSKSLKVSPAAIFHTCWAVVVSACSARDDVVFGTVMSGRLQGTEGAENMIGVFINTLPLRVKLTHDSSVLSVIKQMHLSLMDLLPFEQASLALAQKCSSLSGDVPLFSALMNYRHSELIDGEDEALISNNPGADLIFGQERTNYPFNLSVDDWGERFSLEVQVDKAISAERVVEYVQTTLASLVQALSLDEKVSTLNVLPQYERHQLLVELNDTATDYETQTCVHTVFEAQVEKAPNAIAAVCDGQQLTYGELNEKANRLAHYLINEKNVVPDTLIGICIERSLEMVIAIVGILKAGGAYVPLDPEYPEVRLQHMLDDAGLTTVLTQRHVLESTPVSDVQALCLDDDVLQKALLVQPIHNPDAQKLGLSSNDLAYIIYTSGSTGKPKASMLTHVSFHNLVLAQIEGFEVSSNNRVLQFASISFDAATSEFGMALLSGATIVLMKNDMAKSPEAISSLVEKNKITHATLPPALLPLLNIAQCQSIQTLVVAGDVCSVSDANKWSKGRLFINAYGPSETTVCASMGEYVEQHSILNIGKPIRNTQTFVLGNKQTLLPQGVSGELHIGGVGLSRGYLNREDLTAEKFIANPFYDKANSASSERLYKTGDLVRWSPEGNLEFLGRIDQQVKIRGFRIELGEIETALLELDEISDAIVVAKNEKGGGKYLAAYVVAGSEASELTQQMRQYLSLSLPDYMVPSAFVCLAVMPLTPNGKVDRKALPEPDMEDQQQDYIAPRTDVEKSLCEIWQEVLGIERVGIHDNFFHLGGHSLLVMKVISAAQKEELNLDARQLFAHPTLADLAAEVEQATTVLFTAPANLIPDDCDAITLDMLPLVTQITQSELDQCVAKIPGGVANVQDIYPLAPLQEGILFHHMMNPVTDPYITPALFCIESVSEFDDFVEGVQFIIDRHDIMRTSIMWKDIAHAHQIVCRNATLSITRLELEPGQDVETQMRARSEVVQAAINLEEGPLLRLQVAVEEETGRYFVLVQLHHIIADHVVLEIVQRELDVYKAGQAASLPETVPYREFIAHVQHQAEHNDTQSFFTNLLSDIDEPTAPFDLLDVTGDGTRIVELKADVADALCIQIRSLSKSLKVSPAAIFHTCWAMVVSACSAREDVVFGTVVSGRLQGTKGAENMLGVFINTLPLRVTLENASVLSVIQRVHTSLMDLLPFEQASLALAQNCSSVSGEAPLFSALINYRHSVPEQGHESSNQDTGPRMLSSQERTNYPFNLSVDDFGEGFGLTVKVDKTVDASNIMAYVETALANLVETLPAMPGRAISSLGVLPEPERHQLLVEWNDTAADYQSDKCIHQLFEFHAKKTPTAIASIVGNKQLSYQQLNEKANQLAHYLISDKQVVPDTLVGVCVERSLEMVIAILAILKAGGAYVPLDPEYPKARLAYMLEDANLATVLTHSHLREAMPTCEGSLCLDDQSLQQDLLRQSSHNPSVEKIGLTSTNLAYVIYTSGSTGKPKGVMVEHRNLMNYLSYFSQHCDAISGSFVSTNICFDGTMAGFWLPFAFGKYLKLSTSSNSDALNELMDEISNADQPMLFKVTPAHLDALYYAENNVQSSVRHTMFVGGELFLTQKYKNLPQSLRSFNFYNQYGPSETTVGCSTYAIDSSAVADLHSIPLGKPINNTTLIVLGSGSSLSPTGVVGELHITGSGLARGYLNQPGLTNEKFIVNPFYDKNSTASSKRLYKTGDLVRWMPDGNLEFIGRLDHQVKIRGFRIELGEIENTLITLANVIDTVVIANESESTGDKQLIAYVVSDSINLQDESELSTTTQRELTEHLREHVSQTLPDYMVPSMFVLLDKLPLTPNGKVDHKALPGADVSVQQSTYVAPHTDTQKVLGQIWQEVLGVERIGINDNFFHLGGHSLLVMQVISRGQQRDMNITARSLFAHPTLLGLAAEIQSMDSTSIFRAPENNIPDQCDDIRLDMLPLVKLGAQSITQKEINQCVAKMPGGASNVQDIYPLAPLQQGILFHHMMNPDTDPYIIPVLFEIENEQVFKEFIDGLQFIVDRHDIMRTAVVWKDVSPALQVVCRNAELIIDWYELGDAENAEQTMRARSQAPQAMDIELAPLLRLEVAADQKTGQHFVLVQLHHIISDHVGLEVIGRELALHKAGQTDTLAATIPYREFVAHVQHLDQLGDAEAFFTSSLGHIDEPTAPFNLLNVNNDGTHIDELKADVDGVLSNQIRCIAKDLKVSPAVIFHTCWAMVLSACSARNEVVFGTVMSGRLQGTVGAENMLGVFINTLPLCVNLDDVSVLSVIEQVHASLMDLLAYEQASLALAQSCSGVSGDAPLFSALLNYRHSAPEIDHEDDSIFDETGMRMLFGQERTNYPFNLAVDDLGEGFTVTVKVDKTVGAENVLGYVQTALTNLVEALPANPECAINSLCVLSNHERHQLLDQWNDTAADYRQDKCIHELFEVHAQNNPTATAVIFESQQLTYQQLNEKANQLAHYLINEKQVVPDTLVGVCVERSLEMVIGILAILKAGGAYIPLDPEYPEARLAYMLEDANLTTVLTQNHLRETTRISDDQALCLDDESLQEHLLQQSIANPSLEKIGLTSRHLAYVIYTSGSTGKPKGVMVEHANLVNYVDSFSEHCDNVAGSFVNTNICFDGTATSFWLPFAFGKYTKLSTSSNADSLNELIDEIANAQEPLLFKITPAHLDIFSHVEKNVVSKIRHTIFVGGELFSTQKYKALPEWLKASNIFNHYGPSEATVGCAYFPIDHDAIAGLHSVPLGKPINNTTLLVLSANQTLCPTGVVGELHIGGDGLARGYLNRRELTDEKFISNPFYDKTSSSSCQRLYKTGDLVRWLPDGNLEFLDRIDNQVKIRGFRIELGEIENALMGLADVQDTIVLAKDSSVGDKYLAAYVVVNNSEGIAGCSNECSVLIEQIRDELNLSLPDYMVPASFVFLDVLPLTPNGKIDRKALPEPDVSQQQNEYVAPRDEVEKTMCSIWQEVLCVERVGISDNFFLLGGDSLVVMSVVVKCREHGVFVQPKDVISGKTIDEISKRIKSSLQPTVVDDTFANVGAIPLTPWQINLLKKHGGDGINQYNMFSHYTLNFSANLTILTEALNQVISRHDALRTRFHIDDSVFTAEIKPHIGDAGIDFTDLSVFEADEREKRAFEQLNNNKKSYINVTDGPLIKLLLWRFGDQQPDQLLIVVSHIVCDGYSMKIIYEDLITAYKQIESGKKVLLAQASASPMFAAHQINAFGKSDALIAEVDYWASFPFNRIASLKADFNDVNKDEITSGQRYIWKKYSKEDTQSIVTHLSQFDEMTIADLLTFLVVEGQNNWLEGDYFRVNVINSGRTFLEDEFYVDLSRAVGYYNLTKLFFLKSCYDGDGLAALNKMVAQIKSLPTKGVGVRYLLSKSDDQEISQKIEPLKNYLVTPKVMMIQYYGVVDSAAATGIKPGGDKRVGNIHRISVEAQIQEGSLQIRWSYNKNIYTEKTMNQLVGFVDNLMCEISKRLESENSRAATAIAV